MSENARAINALIEAMLRDVEWDLHYGTRTPKDKLLDLMRKLQFKSANKSIGFYGTFKSLRK